MNKTVSGFLPFALMVATNIITLNYLGMNFDSTDMLDPDDWRRKWILVLAYLQIITVALTFVFTVGTLIYYLSTSIRTGFYGDMSNMNQIVIWMSFFLLIIVCVFSIMTSVFVIIYLGPTFEKSSIQADDWKRKWIIFFSWFALASQLLWLLIIPFLPVILENYYRF